MKQGNYKVLTNVFSKFLGFRFSLNKKKILIFDLGKEKRIGATIDMFFVFFPLDVYWLDENKNIVDTRKKLKPFRIAVPRTKARYIVEYCSGSFNESVLSSF
ncbi:MAG: DUF192 domain-containing protein [Candidatus Nanoarchaeia archaeon]|nr:DUF192 domain-containing protein [Candidatus Nanoarchaeia archaeon]